ncbi:hypothetical protein V5O48_006929 [Marasmius crinis-equi]|uniref:Uncharacterized protein n=1 Tax=Marasmius crinis-equi TaxID=585013 RepID=A0ABR3FIB1_9AGAR
MLKRQRAPSPPPSVSNVSSTGPFDLVLPFSKRQRMLPSEGLSQPNHSHGHWEEDEEYSDDLENGVSQSAIVNSPYKETNSVLYELHTLHRHRLLFSQSQQRSSTHKFGILSEAAKHANDAGPTQSLPQPIAASYQHLTPSSPLDNRIPHSGSNSDAHPEHEVQSVRERYEDTNRLLGSLFLSRRRELEPDDQGTSH